MFALCLQIPMFKSSWKSQSEFDTLSYKCKILYDDLREITEFLYKNTIFAFKKKFEKRFFDRQWVSPLSPLFTDIVMDDLESSSLNIFEEKRFLLFHFRCVDNILKIEQY